MAAARNLIKLSLARQKAMKKRSLRAVNEDFEAVSTLRLYDDGVAHRAPVGFNNAARKASANL
jgi:hypothetical protein